MSCRRLTVEELSYRVDSRNSLAFESGALKALISRSRSSPLVLPSNPDEETCSMQRVYPPF